MVSECILLHKRQVEAFAELDVEDSRGKNVLDELASGNYEFSGHTYIRSVRGGDIENYISALLGDVLGDGLNRVSVKGQGKKIDKGNGTRKYTISKAELRNRFQEVYQAFRSGEYVCMIPKVAALPPKPESFKTLEEDLDALGEARIEKMKEKLRGDVVSKYQSEKKSKTGKSKGLPADCNVSRPSGEPPMSRRKKKNKKPKTSKVKVEIIFLNPKDHEMFF